MEEIRKLTLDELYISPFTKRRVFNEDGEISYVSNERNLSPTGIPVIDIIPQSFTNGIISYEEIAKTIGCNTNDLLATIHVLTGVGSKHFKRAYLFRHADDLLRYTAMSIEEIARQVGASTPQNLSQLYHDHLHTSPTRRREAIRKPMDVGRFLL